MAELVDSYTRGRSQVEAMGDRHSEAGACMSTPEMLERFSNWLRDGRLGFDCIRRYQVFSGLMRYLKPPA